jgi:hypothetical protein
LWKILTPIFASRQAFSQTVSKRLIRLVPVRFSYALKWDYEQTGVLSLQIDSCSSEEIRKEWNDGTSKRVEDQLKDFLINLVTIADLEKKRRLEIEERKKRWQEELKAREELERRRQEEQKRLQDFGNQALRWTKAAQPRA